MVSSLFFTFQLFFFRPLCRCNRHCGHYYYFLLCKYFYSSTQKKWKTKWKHKIILTLINAFRGELLYIYNYFMQIKNDKTICYKLNDSFHRHCLKCFIWKLTLETFNLLCMMMMMMVYVCVRCECTLNFFFLSFPLHVQLQKLNTLSLFTLSPHLSKMNLSGLLFFVWFDFLFCYFFFLLWSDKWIERKNPFFSWW